MNIRPVLGQNNIKLNCIHDFVKIANLNEIVDDYNVYSLDKNELFNENAPFRQNTFSFFITIQNEEFEFLIEEVNMVQSTNFYTLDKTEKKDYKFNSNLKTFKGHFKDGRPGYIRLTIGDKNFIYGTIKNETDEFFIEPLHYFDENYHLHNKFVVYNSKNLSAQHSNYYCHRQEEVGSRIDPKQNGTRNVGQCYKVSYSILADYSMVIDPAHPGVSNVISHVVAVMNNIQGLYEYDGSNNFTNGIKFEINEIVVSTCAECDPISSSKIASTVLNEFSEWVYSGGFTREVQAAQFWTDRIFNSSIIGLANQSKNLFCDSKAHSIIRDYTTTAGLLRTLVAHEIAHNFNGVHDNISGQILTPTVTATSTWSPSSKVTISNEISAQAACFKDCQNDLCEAISNLSLSDIASSSFKISWSPLSSNHKYRITLKKLNTNEVIYETITSNHTHILSPPGYTICEKYTLSIGSICPDNSFGDENKIIFSSPTGQGCANFVSDCKVNWPNGMIKFTDKSTNAVSWLWDFGNGITSTAQHPQVSFTQTGVYDVSLTVNNGNHNCTKEEFIHILPEISPESVAPQNNDEFTELFMPDILEGNFNVWEYGNSDNFLKTKGNAWKTILQSNIPKGTYKSVLYSPKFDLSLSPNYILNFDLSMQVEFCNAPVAAQLQYSIDNGLSWQRLGNAPDFYNNAPGQNCSITSKLFADRTGWAFTGHYQNKSLDLSFLAGNKSVIFRFVFAVDGIFISGYDVDGLLVDNFLISSLNTSVLGINANSLVVNRTPDNSNLLEWEADEVTKLDRFEVLKSIDGKKFDFIHTLVKINHFQKKYMYLDDSSVNIYSPYTFYQVRSIDYDSKTVSSNIVKIKNQLPEMKLFPNPVSKGVALTMLMNIDMNHISYKIFDVFSRLVHSNHAVNSLNNIDVSTLESGTYTIMIYSGKEFVTAQTVVII